MVPIDAPNHYLDQTVKAAFVLNDSTIEIIFNRGDLPHPIYLWLGLKEGTLYAAFSGFGKVAPTNGLRDYADQFRAAKEGSQANKYQVRSSSPQEAYDKARITLKGTTLAEVINILQS